jgi:peptidoglycan/xylan/chitin deacetylase (PgdA/CDA1 family)
LYKYIRNKLSKLKFGLGYNPGILKNKNQTCFIPEPYKSVVLLYADFELAWAWRYSKSYINKKEEIKKLALLERDNIPEIIKLCEKYDIPVTWATVGHLFLESCNKNDGIAHPEIKRNYYFENDYWAYNKGDWFDDDPCGNYKENPEWYCPDLINSILNSSVKHEIGCHTFSHIDCRDEVCNSEVFNSEIDKCKDLAERNNLELKSFVHPGHTIGNLDNLFKSGFKSFRTDYGNILGYPDKDKSGLWEIKGTMELAYRKKWDIDYNIKFYKTIIDRAIKNNLLCVFWFHPSFDKICLEKIFPEVLSYLKDKSESVLVTTAGEYTDWLNNNNK